jgi:hypothetical protein
MGGKQLGFSDYELTTAKKQTKREKFLSEMEAVVPWQAGLTESQEQGIWRSPAGAGWMGTALVPCLRFHRVLI